MTAFFDNLSLIADSIFGVLTQVFSLYTSTVIFLCVLGLWVLRRILKLFHML